MLLYIVRHGQTDHNKLGLVQGTLDVPLNATGRAQAARLAQHLALVPFRQAYTSDLKRAEETARIVLAEHPKCVLNLDERLRERGLGSAEGRPWAGAAALPADAEPEAELDFRLAAWLSSLIAAHTPLASPAGTPRTPTSPSDPGSGTVLAVTHSLCLDGLLRLFRAGAAGVGADVGGLDGTGTHVGETAVTIVRLWWEEGAGYAAPLVCRGRVEAWGTADHLEDADA
ncbi:hypothetical protein Q5752_004303 [Cryptotrichosporon argae]